MECFSLHEKIAKQVEDINICEYAKIIDYDLWLIFLRHSVKTKSIVPIPSLTPVLEAPIFRFSNTIGYSKILNRPFDLTISSSANLYPLDSSIIVSNTCRSTATKPLIGSWILSFNPVRATLQNRRLKNWRATESFEAPPSTYRDPTTTG